MTNDHLKKIELEFLSALNWNIYVSNEEFFRKFYTLETILARKQGLHRGWFTYVELNHLLPSITIAKSLVQYTLTLTMGYAAFVATIVGSIFLASQVPGTSLYASTHPSTATGTPSSTITTTSTQVDSSHLAQGKTESITGNTANEIDELELDVTEQLASMQATVDTMLSQQQKQRSHLPSCSCDHRGRGGCMNTTSTHPLSACHPTHASIFEQMSEMQRITDAHAAITHGTGIEMTRHSDDATDTDDRIAFNWKSLVLSTNDDREQDSAKRRNHTSHDHWLLATEHRDITAEISSCSKNDFGLVIQWRKLV